MKGEPKHTIEGAKVVRIAFGGVDAGEIRLQAAEPVVIPASATPGIVRVEPRPSEAGR